VNGQELVDLTIAKLVPITAVDQAANVNNDFVLAAVNEAYHVIERSALWKWSEQETTFASAVGTSEYAEATVASDLITIQHIWDAEQQCDLTFLDERQAYHSHGKNVTGIPEAWSRWSGNIILHPTPSVVRTFTVRYYGSWTDLGVDDSPVFPTSYHDILTDYAANVLALRLPPTGGRFLPGSRAEPHKMAFVEKLSQMVNDPRSGVTMDEIRNHDWDRYVSRSQDW